jgi:hypothetical protein
MLGHIAKIRFHQGNNRESGRMSDQSVGFLRMPRQFYIAEKVT